MGLVQKQFTFAENLATLILKCVSLGYDGVTVGEAYRPPEMAEIYAKKGVGIKNSLHTKRLAVDLNAFKDGKYLDGSSEYKALGDYWKSLHPDNRWGGDFVLKPDGNHFSMEHEGVK